MSISCELELSTSLLWVNFCYGCILVSFLFFNISPLIILKCKFQKSTSRTKLKFHSTDLYSVALLVFFVNSIRFLRDSITELLWYRLSMTLSLVVHLVWLIIGALTPKGQASFCQLVAISSTVWPINIRGVSVQLFMERWFNTYLFVVIWVPHF